MNAAQYPFAQPQPRPPPQAAPVYQRFAGGSLPDLSRAFNDTLQSFTRDLGPYALAGVGLMVIVIPISMVLVFVIYGGIALVAFGSMAAQASHGGGGSGPDDLLALGIGLGSVGFYFLAILGMTVALAPFSASLMRAIAWHQRGERPLGFDSVFSSFSRDLGSTIGVSFLAAMLGMVGVTLCFFPALIVGCFLVHAFPLVALHRLPAWRSIKLSAGYVNDALGWHAKYFGVVLLMNMIAGYIPIVGPVFAYAYMVRVYRELMGDGERPALERPPAA
jgi:hypothetical protein